MIDNINHYLVLTGQNITNLYDFYNGHQLDKLEMQLYQLKMSNHNTSLFAGLNSTAAHIFSIKNDKIKSFRTFQLEDHPSDCCFS